MLAKVDRRPQCGFVSKCYVLLWMACLLSGAQAATANTASTSAIKFVQVAAVTPQSATADVVISYPLAQTAGDLNIVVVGWNDTSASVRSVTDSLGNTYALAVGPTKGTALTQSIYYAKNILGGKNAVSVVFSQAANFPDIRILEYTGVSTTSPLDVTAGASGSSGNGAVVSSGTATTSSANELIFAAGTTSWSFTKAGAGFSGDMITSGGNIAEHEVVSAAGSYSATAILGASGTANWVLQMAAFKASVLSTSPSGVPPVAASSASLNSAAVTPQSATADVVISYPLAQTAGDLNIVVVGWNDTSASVRSVTDSLGNTYALAVGPTKGTALTQSIYYAKNILGGKNAVSVVFSQAANFPDIRILEYTGVSTTSPLDVTAGASGSSGNGAVVSSGTATTSSANELIFAAGTTSWSFTKAGAGFSGDMITSGGNIAEHEVVSAAGSYSATAILGASGTANWVLQMAAFKLAGAATTTATTAAPPRFNTRWFFPGRQAQVQTSRVMRSVDPRSQGAIME